MKHNAVSALTITVAISLFLIVLLVGAFLIGSHNNEEAKKSFDNTYEIIRLATADNKSGVFAVRGCNNDYEVIQYFTSRYSFVFVTEVYWANKNNDFFVLSHDTGVTPYIYKNNTWETGYMIQIDKSVNNEYHAKLVNAPGEDGKETSVDYDTANIPKEVLDYLTQ